MRVNHATHPSAAELARFVEQYDPAAVIERQRRTRAQQIAAAVASRARSCDVQAVQAPVVIAPVAEKSAAGTRAEKRQRAALEREARARKAAERKAAQKVAKRRAAAERKAVLAEARRKAREREKAQEQRRKAIAQARAMMARAKSMLREQGVPVKARPDEAVPAARNVSFAQCFDRVLAAAAKRHGVAQALILVRTREAGPMRFARFEVCWRLKRESAESLHCMARALNRHHASVIHSIERFEDELSRNAPWALAAKQDSDAAIAAMRETAT